MYLRLPTNRVLQTVLLQQQPPSQRLFLVQQLLAQVPVMSVQQVARQAAQPVELPELPVELQPELPVALQPGTTSGTTDGTTTGTTDGTTTDNNSQDTTAKDKDTATSEDEQTPKSLVDLDDEDTPKGNIDAKDKTSKTPIAAGIGIIVVAVAALVGLIVFLKKRAK